MAALQCVSAKGFSPAAVEMACVAMQEFIGSFAHAPTRSGISPYEHGADARIAARMAMASRMSSQRDDTGEDVAVATAAAGTIADRERLEAVLHPSPLQLPDGMSADSIISVSKIDYPYEWPHTVKVPWTHDTLFRLKGDYSEDGHTVIALANTLSPPTKAEPADTLVAVVEKTKRYEVNVMFVKVPDDVPPALRRNNDEVFRQALVDIHSSICKKSLHTNLLAGRPLRTATMYKFAAPGSPIDLTEVTKLQFGAGRTVDVAVHSCALSMNETGGSILATTMLVSRGMPPSPPADAIDMPFNTYRNGYLVFIDCTHTGSSPDDNPVLLAAALVKCDRV